MLTLVSLYFIITFSYKHVKSIIIDSAYLNLPGLTSECCTVAEFVIVVLQTTLRTKFVGMFVIHCHTNFHVPSSNGSKVIAVKV
jgi:hypothetical protein